ncbi:MAG: M28 family peptidase [Gemmatimonadaceae bacterium]|nr:M28 family peptidase [Gemmatimonadaceae bacterium]NUQ92091.1 M28 family peptidase [Gemmatimonadaceae bacterium]NUR33995.1 M28 family peptidase [Gemmatimonadaceae bacterium]
MSPRALAFPLAVLALLAATPADTTELRGFSPAAAKAELDWEAKFKAIPAPDSMREAMRHLSARPHHVGSPYDSANAQWILARFKSYGWDAHIERFDVLFPTPVERVVELVAPTRYTAKLQEPTLSVDPTSGQRAEQLPTYNAYSADGDVTAPLVYVNYGAPADYEELEKAGVSVKGAIVIARYGQTWRGIKPKVAAEHGALGCLIYSDPANDGYAVSDTFPVGPMRPPQGVQRGSVQDMPLYPGDPATPGIGAVPGAKKLAVSQIQTLTKIPVLPISYADAQPLLRALGGRDVPARWRGGLPLTYKLGPGPARVHLKVKSDWKTRPIYDVIATLKGSVEPDQWVIRGNHHDAWVNGAEDPISGLVAELEEARAMGELVKQGWKPRRTIIYAAWDGEEPGLLGSTEWAETHADELRTKAVAYLNSDTNGRGFLDMEGSHILERFINDVARDVEDPEAKVSVWKRSQLQLIKDGTKEERQEARTRRDLRIGAMGSGSDYTPFIQHLGIPSLNLGFGGEDRGGIYHSIYDDFYWYTHFSDTSFVYGRALAQTAGTAVMRLADAEVIPYEFGNLAETVRKYTGEVKALLDESRASAMETARELDEGVYAAVADPREPEVAPRRDSIPPYLNFAPIENATDRLARAAAAYEKALGGAGVAGSGATLAASSAADGNGASSGLTAGQMDAVNAALLKVERALTDARGLPGRPWFTHQLYAPGFYTGYGVKTLPAVREAIEQKQFGGIDQSVERLAAAINAAAGVVEGAAAALRNQR